MTTDQTPKVLKYPIPQRNKPQNLNYYQESADTLGVSQMSLVNSKRTDLARNDLASKRFQRKRRELMQIQIHPPL